MESPSNDQSKGIQVIVVGVIFTAIAATLVGLRLFTRIIILRSPGVDDLLMSLAFVSSPNTALRSRIQTDSMSCAGNIGGIIGFDDKT